MGVRGQRHGPAALYSRERPGTHCTGSWVGHRSGLDRCEKSGTGLCDELIARPEESYLLWCVIVSDLENVVNEEALAHWRLSRQKQTN
jgi:hypothetical protein